MQTNQAKFKHNKWYWWHILYQAIFVMKLYNFQTPTIIKSKRVGYGMALTMPYDSIDMECWIYDFLYFYIYEGVIAGKKKYCVVDFVFSLKCTKVSLRKIWYFQFHVFLKKKYEGVIAKKKEGKHETDNTIFFQWHLCKSKGKHEIDNTIFLILFCDDTFVNFKE